MGVGMIGHATGDSGEAMAEGGDDCENEEEFDWQVDQHLPVDEDEVITTFFNCTNIS